VLRDDNGGAHRPACGSIREGRGCGAGDGTRTNHGYFGQTTSKGEGIIGDRNNIKVTFRNGGGGSVYLYSHWGGSGLEDIVRDAVATSGRVEDESYFTRILFCKILGDDLRDWRGETGFGISTYPPDQDVSNKMVHVDYSGGGYPVIDYRHEE